MASSPAGAAAAAERELDAWGLPVSAPGAEEGARAAGSSGGGWVDMRTPQLDMRSRGPVAEVVFWRSRSPREEHERSRGRDEAPPRSPPVVHSTSEPFTKAMPHRVPWDVPSPDEARDRRISALRTAHTGLGASPSPFLPAERTPASTGAHRAPHSSPRPAAPPPAPAATPSLSTRLPAALARTLGTPSSEPARTPSAPTPPPGMTRRSFAPVSRTTDHLGRPAGRRPRADRPPGISPQRPAASQDASAPMWVSEVESVRASLRSAREAGVTPAAAQHVFQQSLRPSPPPPPMPPSVPFPFFAPAPSTLLRDAAALPSSASFPTTTTTTTTIAAAAAAHAPAPALLPPSSARKDPAGPEQQQAPSFSRKATAASLAAGPDMVRAPSFSSKDAASPRQPASSSPPSPASLLASRASAEALAAMAAAVDPQLLPPSATGGVHRTVQKRWAVKKVVDVMLAGRASRQRKVEGAAASASASSSSSVGASGLTSLAEGQDEEADDDDDGDDGADARERHEAKRPEGRDVPAPRVALAPPSSHAQREGPAVPSREQFLALASASSQRSLASAASGPQTNAQSDAAQLPATAASPRGGSAQQHHHLRAVQSLAVMTRGSTSPPLGAGGKIRRGAGLGAPEEGAGVPAEETQALPPAPSLDQVLVLGRYATHLQRRAQSSAVLPRPAGAV
jgi:hypothetical protein